jgi:uncharacterized alkaline shock family protein YloU
VTIYDRILLAIYSLVIAVLSVLGLLATLGLAWPVRWLTNLVARPRGWVTVALVTLMFLAASLRFLYLGIRRRYTGQSLVYRGTGGDIHVALAAVESLVRKVAGGLPGVRDLRADVTKAADGKLRIQVQAAVGPDVNIPELSALLQRSISEQVRDTVGVGVEDVRVYVTNIAETHRRGRVD